MLSNNFQTVNVNNKTEKEIGIQNLHFWNPAFKNYNLHKHDEKEIQGVPK